MFRWLSLFLGFVFILSITCEAQRNNQIWLDYQVTYPFGNQYLLENTTSYQTLLKKGKKWRNFSISPAFEYAILTQVDLLSEIPIGYTQQIEGNSTFEFTPMLGIRYHITQNKRVNTRLVWRYQTRAFYQIEDHDWDVSNRTRFRFEAFITINGPNLYTDKLWYTFMDYEEFIVLDQQLDERYANRRRARVGLGYRLNYKHRFEASYTIQTSRNEIEGEFLSNDNVIQLKYKMYLNPAKTPTTP